MTRRSWLGPVAIAVLSALPAVVARAWDVAPDNSGMAVQVVDESFLLDQLRLDGRIDLPGADWVLFAQQVKGRKIIGPIFKRKDRKGRVEAVVVAKEGELHFHPNRSVLLVHLLEGDLWTTDGRTTLWFADKVFEVAVPEELHAP